jgi:hypothetical protein
MSENTPAVKKMTKTEAKEIRTLVKSEYAFLDTELGGQTARIKSDISAAFDAEAEAALVQARKRTDALRKKGEKLKAEAHELLRQLQSEGFELGGYRQSELFTFDVHDSSLEVKTVKARKKRAFELVDQQVHDARRGLKVNENEAVRKLTLNMCDTDEARSFIENIPSLAELVQMPDLKQLTA